MLKQQRAFFAVMFLTVLLVLLTFSVEAYRVVARHDLPPLNLGFADRLWGAALVASYFLVASGYLLTFVVSYFLCTWKMQRLKRMLANSLLFIASYAFVFLVMGGDSALKLELGLLVSGVACVLIADTVASAVARPRATNRGQSTNP